MTLLLAAIAALLAVMCAVTSKGFRIMSAELDRLTAEVAETKTAAKSAVVLINGLAQQIRDLKNDPAALTALADSLDADQAEIGAAVATHTPPPADPPVEPPVE